MEQKKVEHGIILPTHSATMERRTRELAPRHASSLPCLRAFYIYVARNREEGWAYYVMVRRLLTVQGCS